MVNFRGYKQNLTYRIPRIEGLDSRAKVRRLGDEKRAMGTRMNHHLTQMSDVYFLKGQRVPRPPSLVGSPSRLTFPQIYRQHTDPNGGYDQN